MNASRPEQSSKQAGFTIVELVLTMVIVGVLAAMALPRFFGTHGFEERGFYDEVLSAIRYAQKSAIAQRRRVCVNFTANSVQLKIDEDHNAHTCTIDLTGPNGVVPYTISSAASATDPRYRNTNIEFNPVPASFHFDPSGAPSGQVVINIVGFDQAITVEAVTGYAH